MEAIIFAFFALAGNNLSTEPHWSLRDGCKALAVKAGGYSYEGYDKCASLPRVYSGKEWKPTQSRSTSPSA